MIAIANGFVPGDYVSWYSKTAGIGEGLIIQLNTGNGSVVMATIRIADEGQTIVPVTDLKLVQAGTNCNEKY
jgi:hypothetical protein